VIARELPGISASDLQALGAYEVCARVGTGGGSAVSVVTGRTEPLPPTTGQAEAIRDRSAREYGARPQAPSATTDASTRSEEEALGFERRGV
jgi:hypothetical protein